MNHLKLLILVCSLLGTEVRCMDSGEDSSSSALVEELKNRISKISIKGQKTSVNAPAKKANQHRLPQTASIIKQRVSATAPSSRDVTPIKSSANQRQAPQTDPVTRRSSATSVQKGVKSPSRVNNITNKKTPSFSLVQAEQETKEAPPINFLINSIIYVPDPESSSSSTSSDQTEDDDFKELYSPKNEDFPFRTWRYKKINKKRKKAESTSSEDSSSFNESGSSDESKSSDGPVFSDEKKPEVGKILFNTLSDEESAEKSSDEENSQTFSDEETSETRKSRIIQPFLEKLKEGGFDNSDTEHLSSLRVSIGLNRPRSLSAKRNNVLRNELSAKVSDSPIRYEKFGFYWHYNWYNTKNRKVDYEDVQKFYKQLKRNNKDKAKKFRKKNEKGTLVPYQKLRDCVRNHPNTEELVEEIREENNDVSIYFSFIDGDTVDFNGIYSAYLRIIRDSKKLPTVITTGYEFKGNGYDKDYPFKVGSRIDRKIRVAIAKHLPLGVYYPEPNLCVLLSS